MEEFPEKIPWRLRVEQAVGRMLGFVARVGVLLVWPFEYCLGFCVRLMVGGVARVEDADFFLSRVLWYLTAPLRGLWYVAGRLLAALRDFLIWPLEALFFRTTRRLFGAVEAAEDHTLARARWAVAAWWQQRQADRGETRGITRVLHTLLAAPFVLAGVLTAKLLRTFVHTAEFLNLDGALARLGAVTRPVWYPLVACGVFGWAWFVTRNQRQLAWGIPLVLVLAPAGWVLAQNALWGKGRIAEQYRLAVATAREAQAFDRVQLYERKLAQLGVNTDATKYRSALDLAHADQLAEAYERMRALAPEDRPGYVNAHAWIVQNGLAGRLPLPAEKTHELVGRHLERLKELGVRGGDSNLWRATWLAQGGQLDEAAKLLEPLVRTNPAAAIDRMRINQRLQRQAAAVQDARLVVTHMEQAQRRGRGLASNDYQWWCVAEELLGHHERERALLDAWLQLDPEQARTFAPQLRGRELEALLDDATADPPAVASALRQLFTHPSAEARERVLQLATQRAANAVLNTAWDELEQANDLPPALAEVLGTAAAQEKHWPVAERLLEQAVRQTPDDRVAWNNLAYVRLQQHRDLAGALEAANRALALDPKNFHFRETRGQILVKLARWQAAIADLEYALNGIPQAVSIHASLAEAYQALGNRELAAQHARYAQ